MIVLSSEATLNFISLILSAASLLIATASLFVSIRSIKKAEEANKIARTAMENSDKQRLEEVARMLYEKATLPLIYMRQDAHEIKQNGNPIHTRAEIDGLVESMIVYGQALGSIYARPTLVHEFNARRKGTWTNEVCDLSEEYWGTLLNPYKRSPKWIDEYIHSIDEHLRSILKVIYQHIGIGLPREG